MKEITIGKVQNLITKRPEGMDYETYRMLRREQDRKLRGWNEKVSTEGPFGHRFIHHTGRLEGTLIPSRDWKNAQAVKIVIA